MQIDVEHKNMKLKNCCQMIKDTRKKSNRNIHIKYRMFSFVQQKIYLDIIFMIFYLLT